MLSKEAATKIIYSYGPLVSKTTLDGYVKDDLKEICTDAEREAKLRHCSEEHALTIILDKCFGIGTGGNFLNELRRG